MFDGENHTPLYKKMANLLNKNPNFKITPKFQSNIISQRLSMRYIIDLSNLKKGTKKRN